MKLTEEDFEKLYEECVCAGGSSGIAASAPEHMMGVVDTNAGNIASNRGLFARGAGTDYAFSNDTMKVHKKRNGKKGDAITGTGIVYANGTIRESVDNDDWVLDEENAELNFAKEPDELSIEEPKEEKLYCCVCGTECTPKDLVVCGKVFCPSCAERELWDEEEEQYDNVRQATPEDISEYAEDHGGAECCNCGADCSDGGVIINGDLYCQSCAEHEEEGLED